MQCALKLILAILLLLPVTACSTNQPAEGLGSESAFIHRQILELMDMVARDPQLGESHPIYTKLAQLADRAHLHDEKCHVIEAQMRLLSDEIFQFFAFGTTR